jgi:hypothetical protein
VIKALFSSSIPVSNYIVNIRTIGQKTWLENGKINPLEFNSDSNSLNIAFNGRESVQAIVSA